MQKGGVGRPNAVLALMFMTADVSKPSFYPLPTMTSSILNIELVNFMPYSLAHAVQDLSCMLSSMALMATYKQGNGTKEWSSNSECWDATECLYYGLHILATIVF